MDGVMAGENHTIRASDWENWDSVVWDGYR